MEFCVISDNKRDLLPLLLLGDEQEDMIDRYLGRGTMYVLEDGGVRAQCVVTDEGGGVLELKSLASGRSFRGGGMERPSSGSSRRHTGTAITPYRWAPGTAR